MPAADPEGQLASAEALLKYATFPSSLHNVPETEFAKALLIYSSSRFQLLPELAALLSFPDILRFLYAFAGQTIEVPDQARVLASIRDLDIFFSLQQCGSPDEITKLASRYSITTQTVRFVADRVAKTLGQESPVKEPLNP